MDQDSQACEQVDGEPERRAYRVCLDDHCEIFCGENGVRAIKRFIDDYHIPHRLQQWVFAERANKPSFRL